MLVQAKFVMGNSGSALALVKAVTPDKTDDDHSLHYRALTESQLHLKINLVNQCNY